MEPPFAFFKVHDPNGTSLRVVGLEWLSLRDLPATVGWLALIAPSR